MKKKLTTLLCLVLVVSVVLCGCDLVDVEEYMQRLGGTLSSGGGTHYSEMEYTRPDIPALEQTLAESCRIGRTSSDIDAVLDGVYAYYDCYDEFYNNMLLAYVKYSADLRDTYWEGEYDYCAEAAATVDGGLEELYYALAESPIREKLEGERYFGEGFFDAYEGENQWDAAFLSLLEQEAELEGRYYELMGGIEAEEPEEIYEACFDELAQLLAELVAKRQEIAAHMGYESYVNFAYDFYHYRDYTPGQAMELTKTIQRELVELYREVNAGDYWDPALTECSQNQMIRYVSGCAGEMGGYVEEAFELMRGKDLWDTEPGEYKLNASFEVFLPTYRVPFVFVNPTGTEYDKLTLAHEFGHFAHDFVCGGTYAGTDVSEVLSQGMEYLSLCYSSEDTGDLARMKAADSLCVYVEQAAYAAFEHQLYSLPREELTPENIRSLYEQVGLEFGFDSWDWDSRDFVMMTHYYTEPMYLISYVVSNDTAFQLYQLELAEPGKGLEKYREMLRSQETWFLTFVEDISMVSPFSRQHIQEVRESMTEILMG